MPKKTSPSTINQTAIGDGNVQIAGDNNTVTVSQTFIQKVINIFKSDTETTDQRNRRIMLGHVENFWVKGILEKSLHGAALLELGIKEDPDALTYPWAIKREATKETLPAGMSMLEIFQEVGLGRSLLILGAPGSGKTTMLLELTRQLIERAREDVAESIPVVFNLSSWTKELTLADWLTRELNTIYYVPKKVALTWVKENKMLLLLDGLDEVRQESRAKCVDAIDQYRKENGLTSLVVCSRSQDYAQLGVRLSFDGAIEIQPLTLEQVDEYFGRFGKDSSGVRKALEKDNTLREMMDTPLFLSIMMLAYQHTPMDALVGESIDTVEAHYHRLFSTYIQQMFKHVSRENDEFNIPERTKCRLAWLANKMVDEKQSIFFLEKIQPTWLRSHFHQKIQIFISRITMFLIMVSGVLTISLVRFRVVIGTWSIWDLILIIIGASLVVSVIIPFFTYASKFVQEPMELLYWSFQDAVRGLGKTNHGFILFVSIVTLLITNPLGGLLIGLILEFISFIVYGLGKSVVVSKTTPNQGVLRSARFAFMSWLISWIIFGVGMGIFVDPYTGSSFGYMCALGVGMVLGGEAVLRHLIIRFILFLSDDIPFCLVLFLDHCVDLIFLRRVGGGYIFVHRLLMEHFAAMYSEGEK